MPQPIPFGSYELLDRIAEGGMAEVWRARSRGVAGFEKTVVIKRVLPSLMEQQGFAELLVREARIAARLQHPNIIQVYDLGEEAGGYFIAMEYLQGRDLAAALRHRARGDDPFPLPLRLWIGGEVAKALDYAHRARGDDGRPLNIIHRDISPQNVLLGYEGEVKVADFGIARADGDGLGEREDPSVLRGKYAYMSPEQARGEALDRRSDLYALGALLYELATRRRLYRGGSPEAILERIRRGERPDVGRHLGLPELEPILARALSPDPEERYAHAGELYAELSPIIYATSVPGPTALARALAVMFEREEDGRPNKLQTDVLRRALEDASASIRIASSLAGGDTLTRSSNTRVMPTSRRLKAERRRVALLTAVLRPGEEPLFAEVVERAGGALLPVQPAVAVFGVRGLERAIDHAARAALEVQRRCRLEGVVRPQQTPTQALLEGGVRVLDDELMDAEEGAHRALGELLAVTPEGRIGVPSELLGSLDREFRLRREGAQPVLEGYRSRRDREATRLRARSPLVGRDAVLGELAGALEAADAGGGGLLLLHGGPASGKSRLLAELRVQAPAGAYHFLQGRADESDRRIPFAPLADLVRDLCGMEGEDDRAVRHAKLGRLRVLGLRPAEVRRVGELFGLSFPVSTRVRLGRPRGLDIALALRRALQALARERTVVVALEDLHFMDEASRQVLSLLVEGLRHSRVLVLLTSRPGTIGPVPRAEQQVELPPLTPPDAGRLLAHWLGAEEVDATLRDRVMRETGGLPGWIEELAPALAERATIEGGVARLREDGPLRLPVGVVNAVGAWVASLRPRDRSMLRVAATYDGPVSLAELSAAEGFVGTTGRPFLRRLLVRRLLVPAAPGARLPERLGAWGGTDRDQAIPEVVRLPSELLRRALLEPLEEVERRRLHGRIVKALERRGDLSLEGLERLAHHALRSGDPRRAPDYHARAAERALAEHHPRRAARHWGQASALRVADTGNVADEGAFEDALRAVMTALDAGDVGFAEATLDTVRPAASRLEAEPAIRLALADARCGRRRLDPGRVVRALSPLDDLDDAVTPALQAEGLLLRGEALLEVGRLDEALEVLVAAEARAEPAAALAGRVLAARARALALSGDLEEADRAMGRTLALVARRPEAQLRYEALGALAEVQEVRGEVRESALSFLEAATVALELEQEVDATAYRARAAVNLFLVGDAEQAGAEAARARQAAEELELGIWAEVASAVQAAVAGSSEDLERWGRTLVDRGRAAEAAQVERMRAALCARRGEVALAAEALERARTLARAAGRPGWAASPVG